uniref:Uncharacterized protein n=1 Tax=Lepeophtheirus salmonis TaxID=72036 RepID=A0A0K2V5N1_LEPSM
MTQDTPGSTNCITLKNDNHVQMGLGKDTKNKVATRPLT